MREAALRNGRSKRKDHDAVRASIGKAQQFLHEYPVADDQRVRTWCLANREDVTRVVPGNAHRKFQRLLMETL